MVQTEAEDTVDDFARHSNQFPQVGPAGSRLAYDAFGGDSRLAIELPETDAVSEIVPLPVVALAPEGFELPCPHRMLPFTFDPYSFEYDTSQAFWMMWVAMRSFVFDDPATEAEFAKLGYSRFRTFDTGWTSVQAFVAGNEQTIIVVFKGSIELRDWLADLNFFQRDGEELGLSGRIHGGFANLFSSVWQDLLDTVDEFSDGNQVVWATGHSMGGALATLAAARLAQLGFPMAPLYTFASPRVGNSPFAHAVWDSLAGRHFRLVNKLDMVPHLPPSAAAADAVREAFSVWGLDRWLRSLDFLHSGVTLRIDEGRTLTRFAPLDASPDLAYWRDVAEATDGNLLRFISMNEEQARRHNEGTYLCRLAELHLGY
jgi:triacylglycerol lipase